MIVDTFGKRFKKNTGIPRFTSATILRIHHFLGIAKLFPRYSRTEFSEIRVIWCQVRRNKWGKKIIPDRPRQLTRFPLRIF